jgi:hypothetical protein
MNNTILNLVIGRQIALSNDATESRAFQLGLVASMMPSMQGVLLAAMISRRERPEAPTTKTPGGNGATVTGSTTGTAPPSPQPIP